MASNGTSNGEIESQKLWEHPNPKSTPMYKFLELMNEKHGLNLQTYDELYKWSIDDSATFWGEVWDFTGMKASKRWDKVPNFQPRTAILPISLGSCLG
jgi:acetoacetyl-CoA synthetase